MLVLPLYIFVSLCWQGNTSETLFFLLREQSFPPRQKLAGFFPLIKKNNKIKPQTSGTQTLAALSTAKNQGHLHLFHQSVKN